MRPRRRAGRNRGRRIAGRLQHIQTRMAVLILTHGAGSNRDAPLLLAIGALFESVGYAVERVNLAFRDARPSGPPRPADAARDRAGLLRAVDAVRARGEGSLFLGGVSYGGRQASMLAAEHPGLVDALLLLSYPLHPPGAPERLRTQHFPRLRTPAVFVHGTKDPFGSIHELTAAIAAIPAQTALLQIIGAGHDLRAGRGWPSESLVRLIQSLL